MHFIYSSDHFLLSKTLNKLLKQLNNDQSYEVEKFSLIYNNLNEIYNSLVTISLFGYKKIIIIEDAWCFTEEKVTLNKSYSEEFIYQIIDSITDNIVIFTLNTDKISKRLKLSKYIEQKAELIHIKKMDDSQVIQYVKTFLFKQGKQIDLETATYLYNKVPNDMQSLSNELNKLSNLEVIEINKQTINANISKYIENDVFELAESFVKNDNKKFINLYKDYLLINDDIIGLIALIHTNLVFFRDVKILKEKLLSKEEIISSLKAHPFRVKLALSNNLNVASLNKKIKLIYTIQKGIINQNIDKENIAEYLFIKNMNNF
ncbi:DNA polymerase III subunit delta [Entomoplasma ellychniae]|uniref:DNA polymerase III subunit delta n=1 Tax=Entomoplasma ellychniae TaxID=2114 RepID=A0A8E2QVN3_9MOLU|nr:DNA polymerase III subunit delta [Entomoplasma ellychniae]PPE04526.1 DNA polymerase III subunit delta [Entomoplasma ellychniae]